MVVSKLCLAPTLGEVQRILLCMVAYMLPHNFGSAVRYLLVRSCDKCNHVGLICFFSAQLKSLLCSFRHVVLFKERRQYN